MPALERQGPFSYDADLTSSNNIYTLVKSVYDPTNGEILEVLVDGVKVQGVGLSIAGTIISGDLFYVNSLTNPTTISLVNASTSAKVTIRRLSNRETPQVDFAPGSVIREQDLDNSTNQTLHVAQEAMDTALSGMVLQASGKFDAKSKVVESVADGVAANDAVNKGQLTATEVATLAYKEDAEDYKLEAKDWADKDDGQVKAYTDNVAGGSDLGHSAKAHASVVGTHAPSTGSAKEWASEVGTNAPTEGSAKEWAQTTGVVIDSSEYSAKEYAQGQTVATGSAKQWALGGGAFVEGTAVAGSDYSAKKYASNASDSADAASASETAARNSANSVTNILDNFGDKYLGTMSSSDTATTASITGAKWVKGGSQITNVTQASGTIEEGQVLTNDGSATGWPTTATVRIIDYNSGTSTITINQVFTEAQTSGETLTGTGYGVYGAYDTNKEGPAKDNDNGNLIDGALYFDTTNSVNSMRVYDLGNTKWVKATSSGTVSISEFKFTATANQTTFTGSADSGGTLSYSTSNLIVTLNGVVMENGADYTASNGTSIVLTTGAAVNDELNVIAFKSFETSDMVSATNGGTFNGNVSFGDNNITNVGDIALDTITADGSSITINDDTSFGDNNITNVGSLALDSISADGSSITISTDTALAAGVDIETSTTGKIKQKGSFMQSSTNQSLVLGG